MRRCCLLTTPCGQARRSLYRCIKLHLGPGESRPVAVVFDPMYKEDERSHAAETRIVALYKDHPRRDIVRCAADINFPNVKLDVSAVAVVRSCAK